MVHNRKASLLEGLDGIEHELGVRKGREALKSHEEPAHASEHPHEPKKDEGAEHEAEHEVKEVEHHLVESGQFDCPHCGGAVKVGSKHE